MRYLVIVIILLVSILGCGSEPTVIEREAALLVEMNNTDVYGHYSAFVDSLEEYGYVYFISYNVSSDSDAFMTAFFVAAGATGRAARTLDDQGIMVVEFTDIFVSLDVAECIVVMDMVDEDSGDDRLGDYVAEHVTIVDK